MEKSHQVFRAVAILSLLFVSSCSGKKDRGSVRIEKSQGIQVVSNAQVQLINNHYTYTGDIQATSAQEKVGPSKVASGALRQFYKIYNVSIRAKIAVVVGQVKKGDALSVWLLDKNEKHFRQLLGVAEGYTEIRAAWNSDDSHLALSCYNGQRLTMDVGIVDIRLRKFNQLVHIDNLGPQNDVPLLWAKQRLILFSQVVNQPVVSQKETSNLIIEIDPKNGKVKKLYSSSGGRGGLRAVVHAILSPDQAYIAFDCDPFAVQDSGVWILNIKTRKCLPVTQESKGRYIHILLKWQGNNKLLFYRFPDQLYQLTFRTMP